MFSRIAIVNRGEAAMRLIHAVRELNAERDQQIETIALYTEGERHATFVREADLTYSLGPAAARPYIDMKVLERALTETGADAAWVGWGFVAEDPAFADLCERIGVTFIGPSADAMRRLGDKIGSKLLAEEVGVPVAPWSRGPVEDLDAALEASRTIGYPLMLKATAGGGGRGIRMVSSDEELRDAYERTREEAARSFGSGVVFLERLVTGARHVEVQVIADGQGTAWALGVRDCSLQRRNQKVIEESASPVLNGEQTAELKSSAERLAKAVGYSGACTVEFLYHPQERFFAFLEVNTRLQVEHSITEITTDVDLVKAQLHVASGEPLTGDAPAESGHAVEARLNAEDPDRDFAPSPGRIAVLRLPSGPGIRVDTGVTEGDVIPSDFDSMIAKIIAQGRDRDEALARLRRALAETTVVIDGGTTNKGFLLGLLDEPEVIDGSAETGWIDRARSEGRLVSQRHFGIALAAAAIGGYEEAEEVERVRFFESAHGGRPNVQHEVGRPIDLKLRGAAYKVTVARTGRTHYRVAIGSDGDATLVDANIERLDAYFSRLTVSGETFRLVTATHGPVQLVEVDGIPHRVSRDEGGVLRSPAPALVVATRVEVGAEVEAGAPVLVLESMKMETVVRAPFAGRLRELLVSAGSQVETGAPLARLEPSGDDEEVVEAGDTSVDLMVPVSSHDVAAGDRAALAMEDLRSMLLGFDVDPDENARILDRYLGDRAEAGVAGTAPIAAEMDLLSVFTDLTELMRANPAGDERSADTQVHSPREHLHTYLQSLDVDRGDLPETFISRLARVLGHYGVADLERTADLEDAVFRIFLAHQHNAADVVVVTTLLQAWIAEPPPAEELRDHAREILDHLAFATQLRFPVVSDLARSVRFRWYDQPEMHAARVAVLAGIPDELRALAEAPETADRAARIGALVGIPERLVPFLADRLENGQFSPREPTLEVLARRHYREYGVQDVHTFDVAGRPFVTCDYSLTRRPSHLVSTLGAVSELAAGSALMRALRIQLAQTPEGLSTVVDLYLTWPDAPASGNEIAKNLHMGLSQSQLPPLVRRFTIAVCQGSGRPVTYFTFRPSAEDIVEDDLVRGIHPRVGRRLNLWRLRNFRLTRLDAPEDVLLYHCVAPDNEADQRLVALAQVRQFTVIRDASGRIAAVQNVESVLAACVEAIGRARHERGSAGARLDMNHIWLHIRPIAEVDLEELTAWQRSVAPIIAEAGVEEVLGQGRIVAPDGSLRSMVTRFAFIPGSGVQVSIDEPPTELLKPMDDYGQKVLACRRRGTVYPYELTGMLAGPGGTFVEYDLDDTGALVPVGRPRGLNQAGIVAGVVSTPTAQHPEGVSRVALLGDPTKALGAVAEAECSLVIRALDLAQQKGIPVEWFALSAGARISMDSGTENMDWVARTLRRIIEFTQDGGEINVVVAGINVGAQPYWNAEATMLMHTKGILVMTPNSAMVLTGKQSLDFSGGVSAEDNFGIGGYDRVMGPNGQAQYWAPDLAGARDVLMAHYDHTYIVPGEAAPRRAATSDPVDRDISAYPHELADSDFRTVGDIFSATANPDRKKAFDIRTVMHAVVDQDHPVLERWAGMADADTAVVQDAHLGGWPVCLLGIESRSVPRRGFPPTDGPDIYTAGTLFPRSSKKAARAINAASGNRPLVVLANLSGFDGSPDSMRHLQLEYGAEIGRAIVNFAGQIVFCVISRYHGGAFVVFSKALNPAMTVLAVEGSYASVIGGAPAAAVVFTGAVGALTARDPRVLDLTSRVAAAAGAERAALATELFGLRSSVRVEKLAQVAAEFDAVHSIQRAVEVGSVDAVIAARDLRPRIIATVDAWMGRGVSPRGDPR